MNILLSLGGNISRGYSSEIGLVGNLFQNNCFRYELLISKDNYTDVYIITKIIEIIIKAHKYFR